jgi:hypothetical protein
VIDRQSVGPVRAVPEPADRLPVWRITRGDGRSKEIHHLDPVRTDAPEEERWSPPDCLIRGIAALAGILLIILWAVLANH